MRSQAAISRFEFAELAWLDWQLYHSTPTTNVRPGEPESYVPGARVLRWESLPNADEAQPFTRYKWVGRQALGLIPRPSVLLVSYQDTIKTDVDPNITSVDKIVPLSRYDYLAASVQPYVVFDHTDVTLSEARTLPFSAGSEVPLREDNIMSHVAAKHEDYSFLIKTLRNGFERAEAGRG